MHYGSEGLAALDWQPVGEGLEEATLELAAGDSVDNPASTSRRIYGPATVRFRTWEDGGIDATVIS